MGSRNSGTARNYIDAIELILLGLFHVFPQVIPQHGALVQHSVALECARFLAFFPDS